jgi:CheY-like chemotaxis protein
MPKRLLIVDDQSMIRSLLKDIFRNYDLDCEEAENGMEAIAKWENEDFNAILMDIEMPEMDGLQATRIIRQKEKDDERSHTPIVAISGNTFMDSEMHYKDAGMDGYIAKPFAINKLLECVMQLTQ